MKVYCEDCKWTNWLDDCRCVKGYIDTPERVKREYYNHLDANMYNNCEHYEKLKWWHMFLGFKNGPT